MRVSRPARLPVSVRLAVSVMCVSAMAGLGVVSAGPAGAASGRDSIHPGVAVAVAGNTCEAGFLLRQHGRVFVAAPASCFGTDGGSGVDGCTEAQIPYGSRVSIGGARHKGELVYSSFTEMQLRSKSGGSACDGNDLGLVKLIRSDVRRATPVIPAVGTPTGASQAPPASGAALLTYVNGARQSAKAGTTSDNGWQHAVTVNGMVEASNIGAPIVTSSGRALGMLSVLPTTPRVGTSQATDLAKELHFLRRVHGFHHVHLLKHPM